MELKFLGRGAAFNPIEGNTSAYFIENKELFLIDCGETVFQNLIKNNILNKIDTINLMITHTHSDHIGSIGSLANYTNRMLKNKLNIIVPEKPKKEKYLDNIENILKSFSCQGKYNIIKESKFDNSYKTFKTIRFKETTHSEKLNCYGILFETDKGYVYYSGDTNELNNVKKLINSNKKIDKIFIDTTTNDFVDNPHLNINILNDNIPNNLKNKVYCMHFNNVDCIKTAQKLGFNIVEINN